MDLFLQVLQGFQDICAPATLLIIVCGVLAGVFLGAMPGVSCTLAVVLCTIFTFTMPPLVAIAFLVSVYISAVTGGSISAILFNIPGTPASAATTLDGYPMALRGEGAKALSISLYSSAFGGMVGVLLMLLMTKPLVTVALKFGSSEKFAVAFLGLTLIVFLDTKNMLKAIISGLIGLWLATIGIDYISSVARYTFKQQFLSDGIKLLPAMIGLFAVTEVLKRTENADDRKVHNGKGIEITGSLVSLKELWAIKWTNLRCAIIGNLIGVLPGAGASIASFMGYATEVKLSKNPDEFGKGAIRGIAASETANNAATAGAMVPLLALGIPGGPAAAMIMAALAMHGVQAGPLLLRTQPEYLFTVFAAIFVANIVMIIAATGIAKVFSKVLTVPYSLLGVIILILATIGSYSTSNSVNDIYIMLFAGIFGYFFVKFKYNVTALVLGLVLGKMCEINFRRAVTLSQGNILDVFKEPITAGIMLVVIVMLFLPIISSIIGKKNSKI